MDLEFGQIEIEGSILDKVMKETPKMNDFFEAKFLLMEAYDQTFGLFDYIQQSMIEKSTKDPSNRRPLSLVAIHPGEDISGVSVLYEKIKIYSELKIGEYFKISLLEFLDLPKDISDYVLKVADERYLKDQQRDANISRELSSVASVAQDK